MACVVCHSPSRSLGCRLNALWFRVIFCFVHERMIKRISEALDNIVKMNYTANLQKSCWLLIATNIVLSETTN